MVVLQRLVLTMCSQSVEVIVGLAKSVVFLQRAIKAVETKQMSMRAESQQFGIPYSTLNNHVYGRHNLKYGRQPALSSNEEKLLVDGLHEIDIL